MGVTAAKAKAMILALPEVEEGTAYGDPAFKLRGKFFARLRDENTVLVLPMPLADRAVWLELAPETYFITDHYRGYPFVLVRLAEVTRPSSRSGLKRRGAPGRPRPR